MKSSAFTEPLDIPARLAIVATLAGGSCTFTELGIETGLADGNLHVQTRKLADAGYINRESIRKGARQATRYAITEFGRQQIQAYVERLRKALGTTVEKPRPRSGVRPSRNNDPAGVW